jgi:hypothetical protein
MKNRLGKFRWCDSCLHWESEDRDPMLTHHDLGESGPERPEKHNFEGDAHQLAECQKEWDKVGAVAIPVSWGVEDVDFGGNPN